MTFMVDRRRSVAAVLCLLSISIFSYLPRHASTQTSNVGPLASGTPDLGTGASLNGVRPFPATNPWNQDVSHLPVHPNSANLIASVGSSVGLHPDFGTFWEGAPIGIPYVFVAGSQAKVPVNFTNWPGESDPGPYPIPASAPIEGGP